MSARLILIVRDAEAQPGRILPAERPHNLKATRAEAKYLAAIGFIGGSVSVVEWAGEGYQPRPVLRYERLSTSFVTCEVLS